MIKEFNPVGVFVTGERFSGKDTFANILQQILEQKGIVSVIRSTALSLKRDFCEHYGLDLDRFLSDREYKETYRDQLDLFVLSRSKEDNLKNFVQSLDADLRNTKVIIISDLRNIEDYEGISQALPNNIIVHVIASDEVRMKRGWHVGEHENTAFSQDQANLQATYVIYNNGTLHELTTKTIEFSELILAQLYLESQSH